MATGKQITADQEFLAGFKNIVQGLEEISTLKMRRTRTHVVEMRVFLNLLSKVYFQVKAADEKRQKELLAVGKKKKIQHEVVTEEGKSRKKTRPLYVFLSANTRLYGDIIQKVFTRFKEALDKRRGEVDIMIIGKVGRTLYNESGLTIPYLYFEIPDLDAKQADLRQIAYHLIQYESVLVFHGRFENILNQKSYISSVTGDYALTSGQEDVKAANFLFEPTFEEIKTFFETQVSAILLNQVVSEGALARFASRINAMEKALEKILEMEEDLRLRRRIFKKSLDNKKQIQNLTAVLRG